jgi:hypothetical protein
MGDIGDGVDLNEIRRVENGGRAGSLGEMQ